jgi:predicted nucleic acid-binding protein
VSIRNDRAAGFELVETTQADFDRSIEVMAALAKSGHHRAVSIPDLIIAAVAERASLVIAHYDQGFDQIARITKQPVQWVVSKGSL